MRDINYPTRVSTFLSFLLTFYAVFSHLFYRGFTMRSISAFTVNSKVFTGVFDVG